MAAGAQRGFWRTCRVGFRWCRIGFWLVVLALICAVIYLNQAGLPDSLKRRLIEALAERGVELQYGRMRLDSYGGIRLEQVRLGAANEAEGPQLVFAEAGVQLDPGALLRFRLAVDSLLVRGGRFVLPVQVSNEPPRRLVVEDIAARLAFETGDHWELLDLQARSLGADVRLSGSLAHASAVRDWGIFKRTNVTHRAWQKRLSEVLDTAERMAFVTPPGITGTVRGDARETGRLQAALELNARDADTPWGRAARFLLRVRTLPEAGPAEVPPVELAIEMEDAVTRWGRAARLAATANVQSWLNRDDPPPADLLIRATAPQMRHGWADELEVRLRTPALTTNLLAAAGDLELTATRPVTEWGAARKLVLRARGAPAAATAAAAANPDWAWWAELAPWVFDWEAELDEVRSPRLQLERFHGAGRWSAPRLVATNLHARLHGGRIDARADLDVATRETTTAGSLDFDVKRLRHLLTEQRARWLDRFQWQRPPRVEAAAAATLPAWTNRAPDWRGEVAPTLRLDGLVAAGPGAFRDVPFASASTHFHYSNLVWSVPDLEVIRPEGRLNLGLTADDRTRGYRFVVRSGIDPGALRPLLDGQAQRGLDFFALTGPPLIDGEVTGRWDQPGLIAATARVHATNVTFRGEHVGAFEAALAYTNRLLRFADARLRRDEGEITVPSGHVDFASHLLFVTNGLSTVEPFAVTRAIGPKTHAAVAPYQFARPPTARVNGWLPIRSGVAADARFEVEGGPFRWSRFNLPWIRGDLRWRDDVLTLLGVDGDFYRGRLNGHAVFDFTRDEPGTLFAFDARVTDADLKLFMADILTRSNRLEGTVSGRLHVTSAQSADWQSWQGYGDARLVDGFIWDVPVFGLLSPALNMVAPGLGNSRARSAAATFSITNSVIQTKELEIRATGVRLHYDGTVDFEGKVNARVEAELLRDTFVVGRLLSLALTPFTKIFEYKVTGTLDDPKSEPLYIPKILMMPLTPIQTLRDLFGPEPARPPPAPAEPPPPPVEPPAPPTPEPPAAPGTESRP